MQTELNKIERFFAEAGKLWPANPEFVATRTFYEIWEEACQPAPFRVIGDELALAGERFALVEPGEKVALMVWSEAEMGPLLVIEGEALDQRLRLGMADGQPAIDELEPILHEAEEFSFGERLEVVFDVIAHLRATQPGRNVLEITLKEFQTAVEAIAARHDPRVVRLLRNLRAEFMHHLLERAAEDMAADELGPQLTLPFGETYAAARATPAKTATDNGGEGRFGGLTIPSRTKLRIAGELAFVATACRCMVEAEKQFFVSFAGAEEIWRDDEGRLGVKVPIADDFPIQEGDRYYLSRPDQEEPLGVFIPDLVDRHEMCGRLEWGAAAAALPLDGGLVARPQRSPWKFLAQATAVLSNSFAELGGLGSPAAEAVLGLVEARAGQLAAGPPPAHLDAAQARAWSNAVAPGNPVVLIQGPPGTGKTAVLEAVVREYCRQGLRTLVVAPSNAAVDNLCRRILDLPALRLGRRREAIAEDVASKCWSGEPGVFQQFAERRRQAGEATGVVFAATQVGCMRDDLIHDDRNRHGLFDVIVFDEAGMCALAEFFLCIQLANRAVLFGDHQQLPPFPLPKLVLERLSQEVAAMPRHWQRLVTRSALEWLDQERQFPLFLLQNSYRCQNPRLMRFASTLFYNARVRASEQAEYYRLSYRERLAKYPPATLRLFDTSHLPAAERGEALRFAGSRPGLENPLEATLVADLFLAAVDRYPLLEISIITPYRRQVRLIQQTLAAAALGQPCAADPRWKEFLATRIATVDSFQGGESDLVIISYVRSNARGDIGFVDDPNRINVAHTRCRREMAVIGDLECLKRGARNSVFQRLERAIARDGEIVDLARSPGPGGSKTALPVD